MKLNNVENLKTQLGELAANIEATKDKVRERFEEESHHSNKRPKLKPARKEEFSIPIAISKERTVICTPGGTK